MTLGAALGDVVTECRAMGASSRGISTFASDVDIQDLPGFYPAQPTVRNLLLAGWWDSMISKSPSNPRDPADGPMSLLGRGHVLDAPTSILQALEETTNTTHRAITLALTFHFLLNLFQVEKGCHAVMIPGQFHSPG